MTDLGRMHQSPPKSPPQVTPQAEMNEVEMEILNYCIQAHSVQEILMHLGLKDRKNLMRHIRNLLERGRIAQTIPDKPNSSKQKYIIIK